MATGGAGGSTGHIARLAFDIDFRIELHRNAHNQYVDIKGVLGQVLEEKEKLHQEQQEIHELRAAKEELARKNKQQASELEALKEKLQESEARNSRAELGRGLQPCHSGGVRTRSMRKRQVQEHVEEDTDELEVMEEQSGQELVNTLIVGQRVSKDELEEVRKELIDGFLHIDTGGRTIGIKRMGELSKKLFQDACREKLPHDEADMRAAELCTSWQGKLQSPQWHPFKIVTLDGNHQVVLNEDDENLKELKNTWGGDMYEAVVKGLMEMKEYSSSGRCVFAELWNYKEGRKATLKEAVQYLWKQVNNLRVVKRRITLREK